MFAVYLATFGIFCSLLYKKQNNSSVYLVRLAQLPSFVYNGLLLTLCRSSFSPST